MDTPLKKILWLQAGAALDMLENALKTCPDEAWDTETKFWYIGYHTLFFLDYYMSESPDTFTPPPPFSMSEMDPTGIMPERTYTKEELFTYLHLLRQKSHDLIAHLTDEKAASIFPNKYKNYNYLELILYNNIRHVQHHTGQLQLLLRQQGIEPPHWVSRTNHPF